MLVIHLLPIGSVDGFLVEGLRAAMASALRTPCEVLPARLDTEFAFHPERQQYHSTEILARMTSLLETPQLDLANAPPGRRVLGVASVDLYIPVLTFVFGEAQVGDTCAVVSAHRLRQEFYGLPPDSDLLNERLLKEALHELGHTLELAHCDDYRCVMAPSHSVEWIDVKSGAFCPRCRASILMPPSSKKPPF